MPAGWKNVTLGGWEMTNVTLLETGPWLTPGISDSYDQSNTNVVNRGAYLRPDQVSANLYQGQSRAHYFNLARSRPLRRVPAVSATTESESSKDRAPPQPAWDWPRSSILARSRILVWLGVRDRLVEMTESFTKILFSLPGRGDGRNPDGTGTNLWSRRPLGAAAAPPPTNHHSPPGHSSRELVSAVYL